MLADRGQSETAACTTNLGFDRSIWVLRSSIPHPAPNYALEPTPTASARASLRLLARLTAGVRRHHSNPKETYDVGNDHREPPGAVCGSARGRDAGGPMRGCGRPGICRA